MRAALLLALMATPAAASTETPVTAEEGIALFESICIDTLPDFEGAGAALIDADTVFKAVGALAWGDRERAFAFATPEISAGWHYCSVTFLSADDFEITEAARDAHFGEGKRNTVNARKSRHHDAVVDHLPVTFKTLVNDQGKRGIYVKLEVYPPKPKDTDTED